MCLRESGRGAAPSLTLPWLCSVLRLGVGNSCRPVSAGFWLVQPMRGNGDRLEDRREGKSDYLSFLLCLECCLQNLQSLWVSAITPSPTGQAHWGPASAGWSQALGSGNLCLYLQPGSGSRFLLVLTSALPHCPPVGGSVFPSPGNQSLLVSVFLAGLWWIWRASQGGWYWSWFLKGEKGFRRWRAREVFQTHWEVREAWIWASKRDRPLGQRRACKDVQKGHQVFRYFWKLIWLILLSRLVRKRAGWTWNRVNSDSDSGQKPSRLEL